MSRIKKYMVPQNGILLLGGDGMLGRTLRKNWPSGSLVYTTRRGKIDPLALYCDLEKPKFENELPRTGVFILAAGITTFQGCEQDPDKAWAVNVEAVGKVAKHCSRHGVRLIFLSSSSVFDGMSRGPKEADTPNPKTLYGKMKKEAEDLVKSSGCAFQILRLTKILDLSSGFIHDCCNRIKSGESIIASPVLPVAPLSGKWVRSALLKCVKNNNEGIFHLSPTNETSYYTLALKIGAKKENTSCNIQKQPDSSLRKNCSWLPRYAKLGTLESSVKLDLVMPNWQDVLDNIK
jgi:dTDP-4-dehydrorhamnose reductase